MRRVTLIAASLALAASVGTVSAGNIAPEVQQALDAAAEALKKASSVGAEWRDSGATLKAAKEAAEAGENIKAMKLANDAHVQGTLAYGQYLEQRNAGPHF